MKRLVSVILPCCHSTPAVMTAVRSVLAQSYPYLELIVIDDGATVDSKVREELNETANVVFIRQSFKGIASAYNRGLREANGDWISFLGVEAYWVPTKIEMQLEFLATHPTISVVQNREIWYRDGRRINPSKSIDGGSLNAFEQSLDHCVLSLSSILFTREVLTSVGLFDERMGLGEDYDFGLRMALQHEIGVIDSQLTIRSDPQADLHGAIKDDLDRFQIFSLLKLTLYNQLNPLQILQVSEIIRSKSLRIAEESTKIGKLARSRLYTQIRSTFASDRIVHPETIELFIRDVFDDLPRPDDLKHIYRPRLQRACEA